MTYIRSVMSMLLLLGGLCFLPSAMAGGQGEAGPLIIVGDENYPPFEYVGDNGTPRGIFVDYWKEWSKQTGIPIEYRLEPWLEALRMVKAGEADVLSGLFRTSAREQFFDYGQPYYSIRGAVFFHESVLGVRSLADLRGFRVGVVQGDYASTFLREKAPYLRLALFSNHEAMVRAAISKDIRVMVGDQPVITFFLSRHASGDAFRYSPDPLYSEGCHPAVRKGDGATLSLLQQHADAVPRARLESIVQRWIGQNALKRLPWEWIATLAAVLLLAMLFLGLRNRELLQRVGFAKESLTRSEERYQLAVLGANDGIWDWDRETDQVYFSPRWKEIIGYGDHELANDLDEWKSRIHPEDYDRVMEANQALFDRNTDSFAVEYRMLHRDGSWRWILGRGTCLRDASGTIRRMAGVHSDVTHRREMEEDLRRSEETLREILENMMDGYYRADLSGRLVMSNRRMYELLGYEKFSEVEGKDVASTFYYRPEDRRALLEQLMQQGVLQSFSSLLRHKNGQAVPVETSSRLVLDGKGQPIAVEGVVRDVSERRRHERELQRLVERLEAKNDELERFTYTVSHDLKSPIITIKGFLGLLERDLELGDPDRVAADLARINNATDRMEKLLRELLELSRVGRMDNPLVRVSLGEVAEEAKELSQGQLEEGQGTVEGLDSLPEILCDRPRMVQVFLNLFSNAAKFRRVDAPLRIVVSSEVRPQQDELLVRVQDNGRGIKAEYLETVFGLFHQLDSQEQGTGLGLALVRRIVENHGGKIWAESAGEGTGAAFVFVLPMNGASQAEEE
ncbi:PAS domain S-box-containing protein [Paucidesulfovibrio gracilis DSM 16080]|uniref:histidine kinase n=1 Tax=Paucidesulfovibrio gracilis DSM 16080 TaxID=1121449 RepID=A0A1T4XWA6_9BACT|nr:transporter substrate-binding domain-containing protein [Paucidesulfovibrio gracilis]SKA93817.1 PAS domain S-box-containing protein [Paucidesulfovibrio gracilis DSM 16080]